MARPHGETAKVYGERMATKALGPPPPSTATVYVDMACTCGFRPYPHFPKEFPEWIRAKHNGPGWTPKER